MPSLKRLMPHEWDVDNLTAAELKSRRLALKDLSANSTQLQTNQALKIGSPAVKDKTTSKVVITVYKPFRESRLGLTIEGNGSSIKIKKIAHDSLFRGSSLKVGMKLETINDIKYTSFKTGLSLLKTAVGPVTVVAVSTADSFCGRGDEQS